MKKSFNTLKDNTKMQVSVYTEQKVLMDLWDQIFKANNLTDTRERNNVRYRQAAMTSMREHGNLSLTSIGSIFNRDHATVLNAMKNHKSDINYDKLYRQIYFSIEKLVKDTLDEYDLRYMEIDKDLDRTMDYHTVVNIYRKHMAELDKEKYSLSIELEEIKTKYKNLSNQFQILSNRNNSLNELVKKYKNLI